MVNACEICGHYIWAHSAHSCQALVAGPSFKTTFRYATQKRKEPAAEYQVGSYSDVTPVACPCKGDTDGKEKES